MAARLSTKCWRDGKGVPEFIQAILAGAGGATCSPAIHIRQGQPLGVHVVFEYEMVDKKVRIAARTQDSLAKNGDVLSSIRLNTTV